MKGARKVEKLRVKVIVSVPGVGKVNHTGEIEFPDGENVFGRVAEFRQYMRRVFPGAEYKLIGTERVD